MRKVIYLPSVMLLGLLAGCGGSGGSTDTTITGSVLAGPVSGATVTVKDSDGNTVAGPVTTGSDGSFSVTVPNSSISSDMVFESSNGTYTDEATGTADVTADVMATHIAGGTLASGSTVSIDPCNHIVRKLVAAGSSLADAQSTFNTTFGFTPDSSLLPADATNPGSGASEDQLLAGLRVASFSQLTSDMGLSASGQFELLNAIADDLSDGTLNGENSSGTVSTSSGTALESNVQNRFEQAFMGFYSGSNNQTSLATDKIGSMPFSKVASTDTYKVQYVPGSMSAAQGKTTFTLSVTNKATGTAISGATLSLTPTMAMPTMTHATPVDSITDNGDGTYTCVVYYLMASSMSGTSMGYWKLKVTVNGETAYFYPSVMMAMGDTVRTTLKASGDKIATMSGGSETRTYYIFKNSLSGSTGSHTFSVFVAAKASMMSYPAVYTGKSLSNENSASWSISSMTLQASTDGSTWVSMTESGSGYWSISGLSGLTNGTEGSIYIKMTINGTQYTTDGEAASGSNAYATFTVTPGNSM